MNAAPSASPDQFEAVEPAYDRPFTIVVRSFGSFDLLWGRWDTYARWEHTPEWFWLREQGSSEVSMGRWRITVSWDNEKVGIAGAYPV
jgi:hypothetical protein